MKHEICTIGNTIILRTSLIRVVLDPEAGGRIRSFTSMSSGKEFLYQDPRSEFQGPGYSDNDISGYCECFPTVAPCAYPEGRRKGLEMGDHGRLWQEPWTAHVDGDVIIMSKDVPQFECSFERRCRLDNEDSIRLDYTIHNYGEESVKYIYSAHPLLYADEHTRLELPKEFTKAFVYIVRNAPGVTEKTWLDRPPVDGPGLCPPYDADRHSVIKMFSNRLSEGRAAVCHLDTKESMIISFDTRTLPYLGVLISQGFDAIADSGFFYQESFLALEPTTGVGDDIHTCESTSSTAEIPAGKKAKFWIGLGLNIDR